VQPIKTVGVIIYENNKFLLVKHKEAAGQPTGIYGIPAGRLEPNESYEQCALRELNEETGLESSIEHLVLMKEEWENDLQRKDGIKRYHLKTFICRK